MVSDFKDFLKQAASRNLPVVLDAATLERVDSVALQLLAAFFIEARSSGLSVVWKEPSAPLCRAAELSGLTKIINLS